MKNQITRSFIDNKGELKIFTQTNFTSWEGGCYFAATHAPCQYCTETCECESCGNIVYSDEITKTKFGLECEYCFSFRQGN